MFLAELHNDLAKYISEWKKAEEAIKDAEYAEKDLNVASIVELRYAGRRFIEVIEYYLNNHSSTSGDDINVLRKIIFEATQNCIRARNDAIDVIVTFINDYFADIEDKYTVAVVRTYFKEYTEIRSKMFQMQDIISKSRTRALDERHELYDEVHKEYLPRVVELYRQMILSEDLIEKDILQARERADAERANAERRLNEERRRSQRNQRITWSIAITSAIIAICSLTVAIFNYLSSASITGP